MKSIFFKLILSLALCTMCLVPGIRFVNQLPQPTELSENHDENTWKQKRKEWLKEIHKSSPETSWKEIEKENWNAHRLSRNTTLENKADKYFSSSWKEVGSINLAGRTHHIRLANDGDHMYLGSNGGGVWKGSFSQTEMIPENINWTPIGDNVHGGAVNLAVLGSTPEVIVKSWNNTIHRTEDGGTTWTIPSGIAMNGYQLVKRMLTFPEDNNTIIVTIYGWVYNNGWAQKTLMYRSTNKGKSFSMIYEFISNGDIWTSRVENGPLYMFDNGVLYASYDTGTSWETLGNNPNAVNQDAIMTGCEAGAPKFYVACNSVSGWKLHVSEDAGLTWQSPYTISDNYFGTLFSATVFIELTASIKNTDIVFFGGVEAYKSDDGGQTFESINTWQSYYYNVENKLHADITAIEMFLLENGTERMYISSDGGTYVSEDYAETVHNISLEGLNVSQYYSTLTDKNDESLICAGAQDQGFQYSNSTVNGIAEFDQVTSGDYGHLTSSDNTLDLVYCVYPGMILATQKIGDNVRTLGSRNFISENLETYASWLPFILADPDDSNSFYFCATQIIRYYRTTGSNFSYEKLPYDFESVEGEYVSCIGIAPSNTDKWYAATSEGRFYYSDDRGQTWTISGFTNVPAPAYYYSLDILVDPDNENIVTVAGSGYSNAAVWRSNDGGQTFAPLGTGQPLTLVTEIAYGPGGSKDVYLATDSGPYRYVADSDLWVSILESTAPMTNYWSVETLSDRVRFGTHGRGIWDYTPTQLPENPVTYNIPHIDWSESWSTYLILDNSSENIHTALVTLYNQGTVVETKTVTLDAGESVKIDLTQGTCGKVEVAEGVLVKESFVHNLESGIAEFELNKESSETMFYLHSEYQSDSLTWVGIALMNPGLTNAEANLKAYNRDGVLLSETSLTVDSMSRTADIIENLFNGTSFKDVAWVKMTSNEPLTGITISGNSFSQLLFTNGVHESQLSNELAITHIANEWLTWNNWLIINNFSETTSTVTLEFFSGSNSVLETIIPVAGMETVTININEANSLNPETGIITISGGQTAVRQSFQSVSGGAAEFLLGGNLSSDLFYSIPSYAEEITNWNGLAVFNVSENTNTVSFTAYGNKQEIATASVELNPKERKAVLLSDLFTSDLIIDRVIASGNSGNIAGINISGQDLDRLLFTKAKNQ